MKKILLSLGTIAIVGVAAIGATGAFYNDTETSANNIFVAGAIDLKVDHLKQSYNGEDCTTLCDNWAEGVESSSQGLRKNGTAVLASRSNPADATGPANTFGGPIDPSPTGFFSLGFGGSIVLHFPDGIDDKVGDDIRVYEATGSAYPDEVITVEVSPNGYDWTTVDVDPASVTFDGYVEADIDGVAPVVYYVRITDISNPALFPDPLSDGYDLDAVKAIHCQDPENDGVMSEIWQCQLWEETDLTSQYFFNFNDIKPADWGRNVISLHVFDNDAFLCLIPTIEEEAENNRVDPEVDAGDPTDGTTTNGELSQFIKVFMWDDQDADGVYESGDGDTVLVPVNTALPAVQAAMSNVTLSSNDTGYIGIAWCVGEQSLDGDTVECSGNASNIDQAQTDGVLATLTAYAVQQRNNEGFQCEDVELDTESIDE